MGVRNRLGSRTGQRSNPCSAASAAPPGREFFIMPQSQTDMEPSTQVTAWPPSQMVPSVSYSTAI